MNIFKIAFIVLRSLFRKPVTVLYPFCPAKSAPGTRGAVVIDSALCIYCGMCVRKCPTAALRVDRAAKTWTIDRLKCIWCGGCVEVCPKKCLSQSMSYTKPTRTAAIEVFKNA